MSYQALLNAWREGGNPALHAKAEEIVKAMTREYPTLDVGADRDPVLCPLCGAEDVYEVEEGYSRWTQVSWWDIREDEEWVGVHLYTDGWDDMSETSEWSYFYCNSCHSRLSWDGEKQWD